MDKFQHRPQRILRRAFIRPHHDLGCEHIDLSPVWHRDPRRSDPIETPDGDQIDIALPLGGRDESGRSGSVPAAVQDKPVCDDVNEEFLHYRRQAHLVAEPPST